MTFGLWRGGRRYGSIAIMTGQTRYPHHWIFCCVALAVWLAWGWPFLERIATGGTIRNGPVSTLWLVPFLVFGAAMLASMSAKLRPAHHWTLLCVQLAMVVAMAIIVPWAGVSTFLVITAWQAGLANEPRKALGWVLFQTLTVIAALAQSLNPDLCWVVTESFVLQLLLVFTGQALRREAESTRALAQTNRELRAAQAIIANNVRDAERLRISRELHDAWGHELTALGLQLEIASHVTGTGRAKDHVLQAKGLSTALLAKVRDVVATLRDAERGDLKDALEALAHSVPRPAIHVEIAPGLRVGPDRSHALIRCAQEAVTNAVKHADASNLWLEVTADGEGVRLVARNDGKTRPAASAPGSGLIGMRERMESLGGKLAVRTGGDTGFTVDAWLPLRSPQAA